MKDMNCRMKSTPTKPTKRAYLMIFHPGWFLLMLNMLSAPLLRGEQMVISEVMYHPRGDKPEYIEFYNQTPTPLDMADWELRGGIHFDFPSFDPDLAEDGFAPGLDVPSCVVGADVTWWSAQGGFVPIGSVPVRSLTPPLPHQCAPRGSLFCVPLLARTEPH